MEIGFRSHNVHTAVRVRVPCTFYLFVDIFVCTRIFVVTICRYSRIYYSVINHHTFWTLSRRTRISFQAERAGRAGRVQHRNKHSGSAHVRCSSYPRDRWDALTALLLHVTFAHLLTWGVQQFRVPHGCCHKPWIYSELWRLCRPGAIGPISFNVRLLLGAFKRLGWCPGAEPVDRREGWGWIERL